jgi:hypothetical protein
MEGARLQKLVAPLGNLGGLIFPLGCITLLIVPGIWFYQTRQWLDSGKWQPISVADGVHWAGLTLSQDGWAAQMAGSDFMSFPLSLALLALIGMPLFAYARFSQWLEKSCEPDITPLN